jgi:hypothetical protein
MSRHLFWLFACILAGPVLAEDSASPRFNAAITEQFTCNVSSARCYFRCYGIGGQTVQHEAVMSVTIVQGTTTLSNNNHEIVETQFSGEYIIKPGPPPVLNKFSGFIQGPNASCETLGMDLVKSKDQAMFISR